MISPRCEPVTVRPWLTGTWLTGTWWTGTWLTGTWLTRTWWTRDVVDRDVVDRAQRAVDDLAAVYEMSAILPTGVADDEHATGQLVGYLIAVGQQLLHGAGAGAGAANAAMQSLRDTDRSLYLACSRAFRHCASLLAGSGAQAIRHPVVLADTAQIRDALLTVRIRSGDAVVAQLREYAQARRLAAIPPLNGPEVDADELFTTVDLSVRPRGAGAGDAARSRDHDVGRPDQSVQPYVCRAPRCLATFCLQAGAALSGRDVGLVPQQPASRIGARDGRPRDRIS